MIVKLSSILISIEMHNHTINYCFTGKRMENSFLNVTYKNEEPCASKVSDFTIE